MGKFIYGEKFSLAREVSLSLSREGSFSPFGREVFSLSLGRELFSLSGKGSFLSTGREVFFLWGSKGSLWGREVSLSRVGKLFFLGEGSFSLWGGKFLSLGREVAVGCLIVP